MADDINLPKEYSYIGAFLTMSCNLSCSYCINIHEWKRGTLHNKLKPLDGADWIWCLNRIQNQEDLPITLQGGEPTRHPAFYDIVQGVTRPMDLLTNLQFDTGEFVANVDPKKFWRNAPYASIRASFHPEQMDLRDTVERASFLTDMGFQVGVYMVKVPEQMVIAQEAQERFKDAGVDFRFKDLLGAHNGNVYGEFKYKGAVAGPQLKECACRTKELIIAPNGDVMRCHSDLYNLRPSIGSLLDPSFALDYVFRPCSFYGSCVGCDIKIKTDRFQKFGYTSVDIVMTDPHENPALTM